MGLRERIDEAVAAIAAPLKPEFAIILGTGLGAVASAIEKRAVVPYERIPHFAKSTVASHKGVT